MLNVLKKTAPALLALGFVLTGCGLIPAAAPTATATALPPTATAIPPTPTTVPTPTEVPYYAEATVWSGDLQVPILIYHRFISDSVQNTPTTKIHFSEFKNQLQTLYDNGFSLVSLEDWLDGTFVVPAGRRPLILTIDDFWFADQIYMDDAGTPSPYSGVGILWQFSQEHPDFGFSVSAFANMGDKLFADTFLASEERFIRNSADNSPIWQDKLSNTMVWALEHGVAPYNHTYTHVQLDQTSSQDIQYQLLKNDQSMRYFLQRINREDLIPQLGNVIALPFGTWPSTADGIAVLKNYKNPEGKPVAAILEAYNLDAARLTPSVFSANFDRFAIQRITASDSMIQFIVDHKAEIPAATVCQVGPLAETQAGDVEALRSAITAQVSSGACPEGIYNITGIVFIARNGAVEVYSPQ
jgi:hypothetical protein